MTRRLLALITLVCIFLATGCTLPVFENPLVVPSESKPLPEFHGVFKTVDPENNQLTYLHISNAAKSFPSGFIQVMIVNQKGDGDSGLTSQTFVAFAEPIDDSFVLHIPFPENCELNQQLARLENKWDIEKIDHYLLLRLVKTENGFSISLMNEEFVEEQIKTRQLAGKIESKKQPRGSGTPKTILVTADSVNTRAFFEETPMSQLFRKEAMEYSRLD